MKGSYQQNQIKDNVKTNSFLCQERLLQKHDELYLCFNADFDTQF